MTSGIETRLKFVCLKLTGVITISIDTNSVLQRWLAHLKENLCTQQKYILLYRLCVVIVQEEVSLMKTT